MSMKIGLWAFCRWCNLCCGKIIFFSLFNLDASRLGTKKSCNGERNYSLNLNFPFFFYLLDSDDEGNEEEFWIKQTEMSASI